MAKSLTDLNSPSPPPQLRQHQTSLEDLKNLHAALHALTPDPSAMSQPEDEPPSSAPSTDSKVPVESSEPVDLNNLPSSIKAKMKKFARYEEKYPILLEAYKAEKLKSDLISTFEKVLLENTPVLTISEASLLVDYINGLNEKTTMLNNELRHFNTKNNVMKRANDELIRKSEALQLRVDTLEEEVKNHDEQLNHTHDNSVEKPIEVADDIKVTPPQIGESPPKLQSESHVLAEKLEAALTELNEVKAKLDTVSSAKNKDNLAELEENLKNVTAESVELKKAIRDADQVLANEKASHLQQKAELEDSLDRFVSEQRASEKKLEDAELQLKNTVKDLASLQEKKSEIDRLQKSVSSQENIVARKTAELTELQSKIASLSDTIKEQNTQIQNLKEELDTARNAQRESRKQVESKQDELLREKRKHDENKISQLALTEKEQEIKALSAKISVLEKDKEEAAASIAAQEQEVSRLEKKMSETTLGSSTSTPSKNKKGKKSKASGNGSAISQNQQDLEDVTKLRKQCDVLEEEITNTRAEKQLLSSQLALAEEKRDRLATLNSELLTKIKSSKEDLTSQVEEVEDLRDQLKDLGNDLVDAREALKNQKGTSLETESVLECLHADVKTLKKDNQNLQEKLHAAEPQLNELKSKVTDLTHKLEEKGNTLDAEISKNDEISLKLKKSLQELQTQATLLEKTEAGLKSEMKKLRTVNERMEQDLLRAKILGKTLEDERDRLQARVSELSEFKSNETSLKLELASLNTNLTHKDKQITQAKYDMDELTKEKKELLEKLANQIRELDGLKKLNKTLLNEKSALMTDQEISKEGKKSLETALTKVQAERQKLATDLEAATSKYEELKNEKTFSSNEVQSYKHQFEEHSIKYKEAVSRIESLEDDLAETRAMSLERSREAVTIRRLLQDAEEQLKLKDSENAEELNRNNEARRISETLFQATLKKKQREVDELRSIADKYVQRLQDAEKTSQTIKEQYETLQASKKAQDKGEAAPERSEEVDKTIASLRESLQETNRKVKEYQNLNSVMKKLNDESNLKFDRISKNYKLLTQQYREMTNRSQKSQETLVAPKKEEGLETNIAYLKNVLLGFMAHKEQRDQLLPVIKQLFKLSAEDEKVLVTSLK